MRHPLIAVAVLLAGTVLVHADEPQRPEWWRAEKEVLRALPARDLTAWAREIEATPLPTDGQALLARWLVLVRAGHLAGLDPLFDALGHLPEADQRWAVSQAAHALLGRPLTWKVGLRLFERAPAAGGMGSDAMKYWLAETPATEVEAWLRARMKADVKAWHGTIVAYVRNRWYAGEHASASGYLAELVGAIRRSPADVAAARRYLSACNSISEIPHDLAWFGDVCKPRLATECAALEVPPAVRIPLLLRALELPFTEEDAKVMQGGMSRIAGQEVPPLNDRFRAGVKRSLMEAYQRTGQAAKAQPLLEELTAAFPGGLPPASWATTGGQIQAGSGMRVIEGRIRKAQEENEGSAKYWLTRALYYGGREETEQARAAFDKALRLAPRDRAEADRLREPDRRSVASDYSSWLFNSGAREESVAFAGTELAACVPGSDAAGSWWRWIVDAHRSFRVGPRPEEEAIWAHLAARKSWRGRSNDEESGLLEFLVSEVSPHSRTVVREWSWKRAVALAVGGDPSRCVTLAQVARNLYDQRRGLPLLEEALARTPEGQARRSVVWDLFAACREVGERKRAESLLPDLTVSDLGIQYAELSVSAARAGAGADAVRLWGERVRFDRGAIDGLDVLGKAGLRDALVAFYEALAKADPACEFAQAILAKGFPAAGAEGARPVK